MSDRLPKLIFFFAISLGCLIYGILIGTMKIFPHDVIFNGIKTGKSLAAGLFREDNASFIAFTEVPKEDAVAGRVVALGGATLEDPILFYGGRFEFLELCPESGCLAVEMDTMGEVLHAYPYQPEAIHADTNGARLAYEEAFFQPARDVIPIGRTQYPNGDLLVTFNSKSTFPYGGGVARVDRSGNPVWFNRDYSHHWPTLLDDESALVPGLKIGASPLKFREHGTTHLECSTGQPVHDVVNVIGGDGRLIRQLDLMEALIASPYRSILKDTPDPCDPLHLNYIDQLGPDVVGIEGAAPGDYVVSLRNLDAFAIIDPQTGRFKRWVNGTFFRQHSVRHLEGGKFLLFDNHGGYGTGSVSRLLMVDLETGLEKSIFPNPSTPESLKDLFSLLRGKVDISPDRERVLVSFSETSKAVELRLSDGAVLHIFTSMHDVSSVAHFPEDRLTHAARFRLFGVDYLKH